LRVHQIRSDIEAQLAQLRRARIRRFPLTKREIEVFEAVRGHGSHEKVAQLLSISRQRVGAIMARCRAKGVRLEET
jgi:DNA-binding CsgD family transcriptional regulator